MGTVAKALTYKSSGVDTTKKDGVIDEIIRLSRKTYDPRVIDHPWGFAGLFSLFPKTGLSRLSGKDRDKSHTAPLFARNYKSPTLVACSDGVGTKLKIAFLLNKHDTVGIDLVAMSINDLIVTGAEPLFFLDYISCGKVQELFPELIECGLNVFNPFQPEVMDVNEMKKKYGGSLSFYGGISTQNTLPYGTVAQVKEEVSRLIEIVGKNGGYFASPAHSIPADAKPENIAAMIEVLKNQ